jgi:hypothetical protein
MWWHEVSDKLSGNEMIFISYRACCLTLGFLVGHVAFGLPLEMGGANDITAVAGRASSDYVRVKLPSGKYAPESYAFGNGGTWSGQKADLSIDKMTFLDVAHIIAGPLATKSYIPAKDPTATKLLIMVYWGTSHAPEHATNSNGYTNLQAAQDNLLQIESATHAGKPSYNAGQTQRAANGPAEAQVKAAEDQFMTAMSAVAAENAARDKEDALNARMLGYDSWWEETKQFQGNFADYKRQDMLNELEEDRYFVVLMAYDFQILWKQKKHKLLWETRFSIRQRHHDFDKDLPAIAQYASKYFGQDTNGLIHDSVPFGHVEIGETKSLGEAEGVKK